MKITSEVASNLGKKLAELDLTGEELVLLSALLTDDDEVAGFELDKSSTKFEEIKVAYGPAIRSLLPANPLGYTEIEWAP